MEILRKNFIQPEGWWEAVNRMNPIPTTTSSPVIEQEQVTAVSAL